MRQYITAKIQDNVLSIGCPEPGCKDGTLDLEACRDMIPLQLFQMWGDALCELALGAFKFYCPFKDCSALLVNDQGHGETATRNAECPHCSRKFCAWCKVEWHDNITCAEFQRLGKDWGKDDLLPRKISQETVEQRCARRAVDSCESLCKPETCKGINAVHGNAISIEDMDSHKGKVPLDGMFQELGQCSRVDDTMSKSEFYCNICMETVLAREIFTISGCTHLFCISCMRQNITLKVEDNVVSIGCPELGCKAGVLEPEACRDMISLPLFQRWVSALRDSTLGALDLYYPFKDCSVLMVLYRGHNEAVIRKAECPQCLRMFCAQCKVAWHYNITYEEFQQFRDNEWGRDALLPSKFAQKSKWQMWPQRAVAFLESLCKKGAHQGISRSHSTLISIEDMDSLKEKEPSYGILQELGQFSGESNALASSELYCTICMEVVHIRELFPISGCTHLFCISCVSQYITAKVEDNVVFIGCPEPECNDGALDPEACRDVIPLQVFQRWGAALCDLALGAFKFYCPYNDCSALLVDERCHGEAPITQAECPHCCRMFCAQCRVAWHDGVTCKEFQRLGKDERSKDDLLLRKITRESRWQRCPKCNMYVERADGCVYMVCQSSDT